jgi:hypothetical protein
MEKSFSSLKALDDVGGKAKFCVSCGNIATQEALFNVDGAMLIEKYCDSCAKKEESFRR